VQLALYDTVSTMTHRVQVIFRPVKRGKIPMPANFFWAVPTSVISLTRLINASARSAARDNGRFTTFRFPATLSQNIMQFQQAPPTLGNQYEDDSVLRSYLMRSVRQHAPRALSGVWGNRISTATPG
jgi:hypothetical protein